MINLTCITFLLCLYKEASLFKLPGPPLYVVTPRSASNAGRSASTGPFYYHNWMRRMDIPEQNATTTTTTAAPKVETPDLIFAEFEKGDSMKKSLKSLLEKERIKPTTTKPVLEVQVTNYGLPFVKNEENEKQNESHGDLPDYFNNNFNSEPAPVYLPSTTQPTTRYTTLKPPTTTKVPPAHKELGNMENIWHIIDSEKTNQFDGKWNEVPIETNNNDDGKSDSEGSSKQDVENQGNNIPFDGNFALPGFSTIPGNGGENESRAIRTEPNMRFPYVNLKPFQIKHSKVPLVLNKKGNNMLNLDNMRDVKHPVRGEIQDTMPSRQSIDRYNPAQPYLPSEYGSKSKQSNPPKIPQPTKSVANLVPPPPPPVTGDDFPAPTSYDSFPPYASPSADSDPPPPPPPAQPSIQFPDMSDDFDSSPPDTPPMDAGYRYNAPSLPFVPTLPPISKPFKGYSYPKPAPEMPAMPSGDDSDFGGYQYNKPPAPKGRPSYGPQQETPSYQPDYPELIYDKPNGGMDDSKANDMGMMPPPPPDMKPADDHGFPHDFPGDFKYGHEFDDHDFHYHHHPPTTTTTTSTTETPRVNRFSYYYLGKKLYYLPLYFSVYFIIYVGALIIKAVLRHKIVYPNSWRPNDQTADFFSKRSVDSWDLSNERLHEITDRVTHSITEAAKKYIDPKKDTSF